MNPGGSVKDRAALGIIEAAEASGELKPGATIVEGTAGHTGIGLTVVRQARGHVTSVIGHFRDGSRYDPGETALIKSLVWD